jgi:16S rRNA (guanine966-N2)-methyltransferase
MRVITGKAKGHRLKAPAGLSTRPMLDRVKESLFSVLEGYGPLRGEVLDLFAGTGSLGIEALSRGAARADFVERSTHVCSIIRENLAHTHFAEVGSVHTMPVERFVRSRSGSRRYAILFMDPPYADPEIVSTIELVGAAAVAREGALLIVGHSPRVELADTYGGLTRIKFRKLGDSCFSIYQFAETPSPAVDEE